MAEFVKMFKDAVIDDSSSSSSSHPVVTENKNTLTLSSVGPDLDHDARFPEFGQPLFVYKYSFDDRMKWTAT